MGSDFLFTLRTLLRYETREESRRFPPWQSFRLEGLAHTAGADSAKTEHFAGPPRHRSKDIISLFNRIIIFQLSILYRQKDKVLVDPFSFKKKDQQPPVTK